MVIVGNQHVGKTCIVQRAISGMYNPGTASTLGASYSTKAVTVDKKVVKMQIWDTAGQEKYRAMAPMYYHNAQVALVVYSIEDMDSFEAVDAWIDSLSENADRDIIVFLVANKQDLVDKVEQDGEMVSREDGKEKAARFNCEFVECSACTGYGIDDLFSMIPRTFLEHKEAKVCEQVAIDVGTNNSPSSRRGCC